MSKKKGLGSKFWSDGCIRGAFLIPERKKYSVIAMNIETIEDVEKVIHQCELIRQEIAGELENSLVEDLTVRSCVK